MRKILLNSLFLLLSLNAFSQIDFGIVGGANFQASGDLRSSVEDIADFRETAKQKTGYFVGLYGQVNFLLFYLRPEVHLTKLGSDFETISFNSTNLEVPVSVGYKLLPAISVFLGPSFQYRLEEQLNIGIETIGDQSTMGVHIGTRVNLGNFAVDLRYERGLKKSEVAFLSEKGVEGTFDTRGQKWMVGISYSLD
jgi:hypothetical protein